MVFVERNICNKFISKYRKFSVERNNGHECITLDELLLLNYTKWLNQPPEVSIGVWNDCAYYVPSDIDHSLGRRCPLSFSRREGAEDGRRGGGGVGGSEI